MGDVESIYAVRFPPLVSTIGIAGAPPEVRSLLHDRWMAQLDEDGEPRFLLRWTRSREPCPAGRHEVSPVRWWSDGDGCRLHGTGGTVRLVYGSTRATVDLLSGCVERPALLEPLVEAALGCALAATGACFLHAAAIELAERRPLVIGETGSGKSTLSAAAAAFGGRVVSDDSLVLGEHDRSPVVRAARRHLWLRPDSERLADALSAAGASTERCPDGRIRIERTAALCRDWYHPDSLVLLRLDRSSERVGHRRLNQAEALAALLRGTSALYLTDPRLAGARGSLLDLLTLFAERLPAIELELGKALLDSTEECLAEIVRALP